MSVNRSDSLKSDLKNQGVSLLVFLLFLPLSAFLLGAGKPPSPEQVTGFSWDRVPVYLQFGKRGAEMTTQELDFVAQHTLLVTLPVWFDEPQFFMDHDGTTLGKPGTRGRTDLALYSSFTVRNGQAVLWYPERKFFAAFKQFRAQESPALIP
jgi:hypothetical protein